MTNCGRTDKVTRDKDMWINIVLCEAKQLYGEQFLGLIDENFVINVNHLLAF